MSKKSKFVYNQNAPFDLRFIENETNNGVTYRDLTYATPFGYRRAAYLLRPEGKGSYPAVLYVHWYDPWSPTSNRREFLDEARTMVRRGVITLLIETMWSDDDWFYKRTQKDDQENTIKQVVELRRAIDLLSAQPDVNLERIGYVGHDFGAMYGVLTASVDQRLACYVLMAGAPRFSDWYLYYPQLAGGEQEKYIKSMDSFDPINLVSQLAPKPILFQFARDDFHIPQEEAQAFYAAAAQPKEIRWYDAKHGLNDDATKDRIAWLSDRLECR